MAAFFCPIFLPRSASDARRCSVADRCFLTGCHVVVRTTIRCLMDLLDLLDLLDWLSSGSAVWMFSGSADWISLGSADWLPYGTANWMSFGATDWLTSGSADRMFSGAGSANWLFCEAGSADWLTSEAGAADWMTFGTADLMFLAQPTLCFLDQLLLHDSSLLQTISLVKRESHL